MAGAENTKCRSVRFGEIVAVAKNVRTQIYTKMQTAKIVHTNIHKNTKLQRMYESFATVGEIRVYWRADFQSGSRVLKKVF